MRRALGYTAFTLGCMLIFLAPLLYFYATPRVEKAPYDVDDTSVSIGTGSYFSVKSLSVVGPAPLKNISIARGFPEHSTTKVAVIGIFSRTLDLTRGDFDYGYSVYAFDRSTGYAVPSKWAKPQADGLTLKFPFHTKKGTYRFWDSTARRAFPATYERTEVVDGMTAYMFVSNVPPTVIGTLDVPGGVVGQPGSTVHATRNYDATTTLWVEPFTGAILKAGQHSRQWLTDAAGTRLLTLADVNVVNDAPSIQSTVDQIKGRLWELRLVSVWFPILAPIVGVIAVVGGLLLLRSASRPTRRSDAVEGSAVAAAPVA
jgi:hypothetical protein